MSKDKLNKPTFKDYFRVFVTFLITYLLIIGLMMLAILVSDLELYKQLIITEFISFLSLCGVVAAAFLLLFYYIRSVQPDIFKNPKNLLLVCTIIVTAFALNLLLGSLIDIYARPIALSAMLIAVLLHKRMALFVSILVGFFTVFFDILSASYTVNLLGQWSFVLLTFAGSTLAAVYAGQNVRRLSVVVSSMKIGVPLFFMVLVFEGIFGTSIVDMLLHSITALGGAIISILLYFAFLPLFERLFNVLTIYRLNELTDHNRRLIKRLMTEAPGTFNHVLVVTNLAEACALAVGEDPHLTRAAAYYHDIGKLNNPEYFKENQQGYNPHDQLTPELSTSFIKKHTTDGYQLAKRYGLPEEIAEITRQHHGTMPIKFFYLKAQKYTDGVLNMENFCYDGPKPKSKIAAIIMIADACEASVRAMKDHSKENVEEMVNSIIEERIEFEQFTDCDITFKDVYTIRDTIVGSYAGFYHDRVQYPKIKLTLRKGNADFPEEEQTANKDKKQ